jgi:hypothetical protein
MPAFSPADSRDDDQQQRTRRPWLPDVVPGDGNDNSQGSEPDRLTLGARIGGAKTPLPIPPNRPAPEDRPPAPQPQMDLDPNKMPDIMKGAMTRVPPPPPIGSANPNRTDLLRQEAEYGKPLDRTAVDPSTGKPKYRMGTGSRILAAVADFGLGFSGSKAPPIYFGPGATNRRYDVDEATRQANLGNVKTQLGEQEKLDEANRKLWEGAGLTAQREAKANELEAQGQKYQNAIDPNSIEQDKSTGKWWGTSYGGQRQEVAPPRWAPENRPNKLADEGVERTQLANQMGLKGDARRDYILTGKLPKDMMGSTRQPTELETWMQAFKRDNGRNPTADEIAQRKARTRGTPVQFAKVEADKKRALLAAEKQFSTDRLMSDPDAEKNLNLAKQLAQESYEQQIRELGGMAGVANQSPNKGAPVTVTDPRGVPHTFPDQKSADAFKKAARIR